MARSCSIVARFARTRAFASSASLLLALAAYAQPARADVELAPGPTGAIGAWLVATPPIRAAAAPGARFSALDPRAPGRESATLRPRLDAGLDAAPTVRWKLAASADEAIDLKRALGIGGSEALTLAGGVLRVSSSFDGFALLGCDDGVALYVDGAGVFARDEARPPRPDDDVVALTLVPGDHSVVLSLHQRSGPWELRVRFVDRALAAARGVRWVLPGVERPNAVAARMLRATFDRGLAADGLRPTLRIACDGGFPLGAERRVGASARTKLPTGDTLFESDAGLVPIEDAGPCMGLEVALPHLAPSALATAERDGAVQFDVAVGSFAATFDASPRALLREAIQRAEAALAALGAMSFVRDPAATKATIEHLRDRVAHYADRGDSDLGAQMAQARELVAFCDALDAGRDPFYSLRGARRFAFVSPLDGAPSPFGIYLPEGALDRQRRLPLVIALHGLNGKPMNMLRWVFGHDEDGRDGEWEDRHPGGFEALDAIVVTPMAHFNSGYRDVGEQDVLALLDWLSRMYPIDTDRVTITGPSMGGTGTAALAFHFPSRFAAAAPLCGYHTYFIRQDIVGRPRQPWETSLAEHRSNVFWAENGVHLPLYVVHGTRDVPVEYSDVLIHRYKRLGYSIVDEHPDAGHNVWQRTYGDLKGLRWLLSHHRDAHPSQVTWKSDDLRYDRSAWLTVLRLEHSLAWGTVSINVSSHAAPGETRLEGRTTGVLALRLMRDEGWPAPRGAVTVVLDGTSLTFGPDEPIELERVPQGAWCKGLRAHEGLQKRKALAGPFRDVFNEPLIFVYGTRDPAFARANEQVARWLASVRPGVEIHYPVVADVDHDAALDANHGLVLVGGPDTNFVTRTLDARLPIHVTSAPPAVRTGAAAVATGPEAGAAFVYPNPDHPSQYVAVVAGTDVPGTLRAMSLPDFLPDYVVYDHRVAPARGQVLLTPGAFVTAGQFDESWGAPASWSQ